MKVFALSLMIFRLRSDLLSFFLVSDLRFARFLVITRAPVQIAYAIELLVTG